MISFHTISSIIYDYSIISTKVALRWIISIVSVYIMVIIIGCGFNDIVELFHCYLVEIGCGWMRGWIGLGGVVNVSGGMVSSWLGGGRCMRRW